MCLLSGRGLHRGWNEQSEAMFVVGTKKLGQEGWLRKSKVRFSLRDILALIKAQQERTESQTVTLYLKFLTSDQILGFRFILQLEDICEDR